MSHEEAVQYAIALVNAGRPAEAYPIIRRVLREDPNNATAWAVKSYLVREHDIREAIYCLEQVLRLRPGDPQALAYLEYLRSSAAQAAVEGTAPLPDLAEEQAPSAPRPADRPPIQARPFLSLGLGLIALALALGVGGLLLTNGSSRVAGQAAPAAAVEETVPSATTALSPTAVIVVTATLPPPTPTSSPIPTSTLLPTVAPVDYWDMIADYEELLSRTAHAWDYDLGIAFVDLRTGQMISVGGEKRYHAMSTFKGPLAAYYLWLLERGLIEEHGRDPTHLRLMLQDSANADTTCIFERVGGIAAFNDWLAQQGLRRDHNFVVKWQDWPCLDDGGYYIPEPDMRYSRGDELLNLPGDNALLACPISLVPCDKAFAPRDLAEFYARLYQGGILGPESRDRLLALMERQPGESVFLNNLPPGAVTHVYTKGGTHQAEPGFRVNFFHEAGFIETEQGAFVLAVFMQRNPEWPGTEVLAEIARISYVYFTAAHAND